MRSFYRNGYSSKHDFIYPRMVMIMKPMAVTVIIKSWAAVLKIVGMSWLWCSWIFRGLWWKRSQNTSSTLRYYTDYDTTLMKMPKCEIFLEIVFFWETEVSLLMWSFQHTWDIIQMMKQITRRAFRWKRRFRFTRSIVE